MLSSLTMRPLLPILAVLLICAAACSQPAGTSRRAHLIERTHETMGSELKVTIWSDDEQGAEEGARQVFAEFDRLDRLLSVWKPGSDIERLNAAAGDHPVAVSSETLEVLRAARQVSEWTGGKFDVTFGALSGLWRFDHDQDNRIPDRAAVLKQLPLIDYRALRIDDPAGTAFLARHGMRAHLGGIGKGYAVDRGVAILRARGLRDFIVQAGGDMYVSGRRGNRPWRVGIRDPRGPEDQSFAALDLTDGSFSTSGDYERYFIAGGRRYHHILDPATGEPARLSRSATIVAETATLADALSTGVFVLGPDAGMRLVERLPHVEAVIVGAANDVVISPGLRGRLMLLAPPTGP